MQHICQLYFARMQSLVSWLKLFQVCLISSEDTIFILWQECPIGTFKNVTGSDVALCHSCPTYELPERGMYIGVRGIFDALVISVSKMLLCS